MATTRMIPGIARQQLGRVHWPSENPYFHYSYRATLDFPYSELTADACSHHRVAQRDPKQPFDWRIVVTKATKLVKPVTRHRAMRRVREALKYALAEQGYRFQKSRHVSYPVLPDRPQHEQLWGRLQLACQSEALNAPWQALVDAARPVVCALRENAKEPERPMMQSKQFGRRG